MQDPGQQIRLRSSARTSVGQVRENNEDNIHLWARDDFVLAVVADGMGGAAAGEEASRLAVEAIQAGLSLRDQRGHEVFENMGDEPLSERLQGAIQSANENIVNRAAASPDMRGMGTTVTLAFIRKTHAIFAHVGDSRAYLVDGEDGKITQVTNDHSFVEALLAAGHITREQAEDHPMRNVLYRALGQADDIDVDMYYEVLHVGDRLVLCSDGLTRHVKPEEISAIVMSNRNPDVTSQKLIDLANERGGEDNVSVIVIAVESTSPNTPPRTEAVILQTGELDDEKTLILKDRVKTAAGDETPQARHSVDHSSTVIEIEDDLYDSQKMTAERLSDDFVDETEGMMDSDSDPMDYAIFNRPDSMQHEHESMASPLPVRSRDDSQGEGRDTLMPDQ